MAQTVKKTRVVGNPGRRAFGRPVQKKRKPSSGHRRASRSNVGQIIGFTLGNPGRKGSMAQTKKKHHKKAAHRAGGYSHSKYKKNPGHMKHYRRRRNPGMLGGVGPVVTNALFVIVGALGSKLGAQMVLGSNNVGVMGYAGNAGAGAVLWFLAEKVMKNRNASVGIIAGTAVQIILRLINDYTPFGQYVSQLGMGDYQMQSFVTPQVLVDPWRSAEIAIPPGWGGQGALPSGNPGGVIPANTPMPSVKSAGGGGGAAGPGVGGLYGGGGGWGGGLYAT
jgi:hypothetical protein